MLIVLFSFEWTERATVGQLKQVKSARIRGKFGFLLKKSLIDCCVIAANSVVLPLRAV